MDAVSRTATVVKERIEHTPRAIAAEAEVIGDVANVWARAESGCSSAFWPLRSP